MSFTDLERTIWNVVSRFFSRSEILNRLRVFENGKYLGQLRIENWFQSEILYALESQDHDVSVTGKVKMDVDLFVDRKLGIELKASIAGERNSLIN